MNVNRGTEKQQKLPPGWRWAKLGEVCRVVGGSTPNTGDPLYWDGDIIWITPTDLGRLKNCWIETSERKISVKGYKNSGTEMLPAGAVVLSSRAPIGYLGIAATPLCTNQGCKSFVPSEKLDSQFLYWSLLFSVPKLQGLGSGATFAEISKSALEAFEISLPSLAEQKRIAAILDEQMAAVEKARAAAEAQLEAAKALPAAYLSQVFPKEGQELSPGWRWAKLGEICIGNGQYGLSEKASSVQQGLPILRMSNIRDGVIFWDDLKYVHLPGDLVHQYRLSKDDLLFNRTNSAELVGKSAVFDGNQEAVFASYLIRYRVRTNIVNPHFLCRYINSQNGRAFIEKNMTRAIGQVNINASTLAAMPIPLPNPDEQARFTAILNGQTESVDRLRNDIEKQLREINSLPAALLKRAFNGEL